MIEVPCQGQEGYRYCKFRMGDVNSSAGITSATKLDPRSKSRFCRGPLKYDNPLEATRYVLGKLRAKASLVLRTTGLSWICVGSNPPNSGRGEMGTSGREHSSSFWLLSRELEISGD